jgi:hypothetical protein
MVIKYCFNIKKIFLVDWEWVDEKLVDVPEACLYLGVEMGGEFVG